MTLNRLFLIGLLLVGTCSSFYLYGQRECQRLLVLANSNISMETTQDAQIAADYFLKADRLCHDIGATNFSKLIGLLSYVTQSLGENEKKIYVDHILRILDKTENLGYYDISAGYDLARGHYYLQSSEPDIYKADQYFQRAFSNPQDYEKYLIDYIEIYFFNIYTMWYVEQDSNVKSEIKQYMVDVHPYLSKLIRNYPWVGYGYFDNDIKMKLEYLDQVLSYTN